MSQELRVALLWHGDRTERDSASSTLRTHHRFGPVAREFEKHGVDTEPVVYNDDFADEVQRQLAAVDGVLVWVNPVTHRAKLDDMLRGIAAQGVFISAHPDVISQLGTKEVLFRTRDMGWGGDIHLYTTTDEMHRQLPLRLATGASRVLKQNRGNSGMGVCRVTLVAGTDADRADPMVHVVQARRNSPEEHLRLSAFIHTCEAYFADGDHMVDQPFHAPIPHGMVRCYLSHDQVVGFGHQYVTALVPGAPEPRPRLYYPETHPAFQSLKARMETEWLPQLQAILGLETTSLPVIWDADFLLSPKTEDGKDTYVLCEINASSVHPYPDSAVSPLVKHAVDRIRARRM